MICMLTKGYTHKNSVWNNHVYATGFNGKICKNCDELKEVSEFGNNLQTQDGINSRCNKCFSSRRNLLNVGRHGITAIKKKRASQHLIKTFGITMEERDRIYAKQDGKCAICRTPWYEGEYDQSIASPFRKLSVDHNHITGKIRGLLCVNCNTALGSFKDSIDLLESSIRYLKESA